MKWTSIKPIVLGGLAFSLALQPMVGYGFTLSLPSKVVKVEYPDSFQSKIEEVLVCIEEAEQELYELDVLESIPTIKHDETRTCREILSTKSFANDIRYTVDYSQSIGGRSGSDVQGRSFSLTTNKGESRSMSKSLTILDKPLELDETNPYLKNTETLEIAMRLFVELNVDIHGPVASSHAEGDLLDILYLRLFNLTYSLPKVQRHPIFVEFMKDVRDSYFRETSSLFFRALLYHAWRNNPDKEIDETLYRYVVQLEVAGGSPMSQVPDENLPLVSDQENQTPALPNPDELGFGDLEKVWDDAYKTVIEEEEKENEGVKVPQLEKPIASRTRIKYALQGGVCTKFVSEYEDGQLVNEYQEKASTSELYRCGSLSHMKPGASNDLDDEELVDYTVYYKYGESETWTLTMTEAYQNELEYEFLVDLLQGIANEHGQGFIQDQTRALFIFEGQPLYLDQYSEPKSLQDINQWLADHQIPLTFETDKDSSKTGETLPENFLDLIVNPNEGYMD